jgi:hypothetical protein
MQKQAGNGNNSITCRKPKFFLSPKKRYTHKEFVCLAETDRNEMIASIRLYSCLSLHWVSDWKPALLQKKGGKRKLSNNLFNINLPQKRSIERYLTSLLFLGRWCRRLIKLAAHVLANPSELLIIMISYKRSSKETERFHFIPWPTAKKSEWRLNCQIVSLLAPWFPSYV